MTRLSIAAAIALCFGLHPAADCANPESLRITSGPALEIAGSGWVIVTWTTNRDSKSTVRFGVARQALDRTATSPNRFNPNLGHMVHRVYLDHLEPETTYFYEVVSAPRGGGTEVASKTVSFTTR